MYGLSGRELRFALIISSSHFTQHAFYRVLPPLIPVLAVALEYPLWQLGLLITFYSLGMGIVQAPLGEISDRMDRIYLLPTGIALTGAAYLLFAIAPVLGEPLSAVTLFGHAFEGGFLVMSLAMVIVGIGLAVVHPAGYPMITDNVGAANKGKVLGLFGASSKLGDAATPAIIAGLIILLGWQQIVLLFGVAGVLYGVALYAALRGDEYETMPPGRRNREVGEGENGNGKDGDGEDGNGNGDEEDGGVTSEGILGKDRRTYLYPMGVIYLFFTTSGLTSHAITTFLPVFLVAVYAYSFEIGSLAVGAESVANLYFSLVLIAGAVMQLYFGTLTDTYDSRLVLIFCMALATVGMVVLAVFDLHPILLLGVVVVLGTGLYGVNPARDALISDLSPPEYEGRTFGYIFTAATLTGAAFPTVIGYVLEVLGMRAGYLAFAAGTVLAAGCIVLLYSDRVYVDESELGASAEALD